MTRSIEHVRAYNTAIIAKIMKKGERLFLFGEHFPILLQASSNDDGGGSGVGLVSFQTLIMQRKQPTGGLFLESQYKSTRAGGKTTVVNMTGNTVIVYPVHQAYI